jgi:hypothetical protein
MLRLRFLPLLAAVACVRPVTDPHASGPNVNQWRATIASQQASVFDAAMRVLSDSSYKIADARKDAGIIKTDYRKESDVLRGGAQLKSIFSGSNEPIRLQLLVLAQGRDSCTVTVTGEVLVPNIDRTMALDARQKGWRFVQGVGEAILASAPRP